MDEQSSRNSATPKLTFRSIPPWKSLVLYGCAGLLLIYVATWVGPIAFYYFFQSKFESGAIGFEGGVLRVTPTAVALESTPQWETIVHDGVSLPLPPGTVKAITHDEGFTKVTLAEGVVSYERHPPDFIPRLYAAELECIGGTVSAIPDAVTLTREIAETTPNQYRFGVSNKQRCAYAARMLTKMRLWRDRPVRRIELSERADPHALGVLLDYEGGDARVLVVSDTRTLLITIPAGAPASWKASPADWLSD